MNEATRYLLDVMNMMNKRKEEREKTAAKRSK